MFYTGEGIERLVAAARRAGIEGDFHGALRRTRKLTRGPKPKRALRKLDLEAELEAVEPTTDGLIGTLQDDRGAATARRVAALREPIRTRRLVEYFGAAASSPTASRRTCTRRRPRTSASSI